MDTSSQYRNRLRQPVDDETNSSEEPTRALAPISRLPPEILASIFAFLSPSAWNEEAGHSAWICITHVCHWWRETALNYPRLWSHINLTKLTPVGMAEILARAKMAPLDLEADSTKFNRPQLCLERQLEAHISHTRRLSISGHLRSALERLVSPAPILEFLSLSHDHFLSSSDQVDIPVNLLNYTTPCLTSLELENCDISWKSPLLKGLRTLKILRPSTEARPKLEDWLDALNEMLQLETLTLQFATPLAPLAAPLSSGPSLAVTLPSLTRFHISASAKDCALALAHVVLPALTWLYVNAKSHERGGEDVRLVIPYVARNVHGLQGIEPLRSILISGERTRAEVLAWTMPDAEITVSDPTTLLSASVPAGLMFAATGRDWLKGTDTAIFDALLTLLPVNSISTLTAQNRTRLSKEFWLSHAPMWPLLERARLVPNAVKAFRDMLAEDAPADGPRLPSLTKLILVDVTLTTVRTHYLRDMLIERVEQGVPLEALDLCTCFAADRVIQLLTEIVVDVLEPPFVHSQGGFGHYFNEADHDDGQGPWYGDTDEDEDDVEYDDEWMSYDDHDHGYGYDSDYDHYSDYKYNSRYY
jgi:hypothetical protein